MRRPRTEAAKRTASTSPPCRGRAAARPTAPLRSRHRPRRRYGSAPPPSRSSTSVGSPALASGVRRASRGQSTREQQAQVANHGTGRIAQLPVGDPDRAPAGHLEDAIALAVLLERGGGAVRAATVEL